MLLWYAAGLFVAVAIAWLAAGLQLTGNAPIGLLSLTVGIALGIVQMAVAAKVRFTRRRLIVGTIILAFVTVLAQHAWLYYHFRRQWHDARARSPEVALFRPESPPSPGEYFARELTPGRAALWCLDAALITAASTGTVLILARRHKLIPDP
jgi:hypothetical protein